MSGQSAAVSAAAAELRRVDDEVAVALRVTVDAAAVAWVSTCADRYRGMVADHVAGLRQASSGLAAAVTAMEEHARALRQQETLLAAGMVPGAAAVAGVVIAATS